MEKLEKLIGLVILLSLIGGSAYVADHSTGVIKIVATFIVTVLIIGSLIGLGYSGQSWGDI